jgi:hypothetical protein
VLEEFMDNFNDYFQKYMNIGYRDFRGGFENYIHAYIKKHKKGPDRRDGPGKILGPIKTSDEFTEPFLKPKSKMVFILVFTNRIQNSGGGFEKYSVFTFHFGFHFGFHKSDTKICIGFEKYSVTYPFENEKEKLKPK